MHDVNFYGANLSATNFVNANLERAYLAEATLNEANLTEANLRDPQVYIEFMPRGQDLLRPIWKPRIALKAILATLTFLACVLKMPISFDHTWKM